MFLFFILFYLTHRVCDQRYVLPLQVDLVMCINFLNMAGSISHREAKSSGREEHWSKQWPNESPRADEIGEPVSTHFDPRNG